MRVSMLSDGIRWGQDAVQSVLADKALLNAAARGHVEAALAICALVDAESRDSNSNSNNSDNGVDARSIILAACDSEGRTPAVLAAENGHWVLAWMLVRKAGAPLETDGPNALAKAVELGDRIHQIVQKDREDEKAKQEEQADAQASRDAGPRVIHVDDSVEDEDVGVDDVHDGSDAGNDCSAMNSHMELLSRLVRTREGGAKSFAGPECTPESRKAQSLLLQQLMGDRNLAFHQPSSGKQQLSAASGCAIEIKESLIANASGQQRPLISFISTKREAKAAKKKNVVSLLARR